MLFLFFIILDFLIPSVIAQIFNPIAELSIATGIQIKEAKTETKTPPVTVEPEIRRCSIEFKVIQIFLYF